MTKTIGLIIGVACLTVAIVFSIALFMTGNGWIPFCGIGGWLLICLMIRTLA